MEFEVDNNFQSVSDGYEFIERFAALEKISGKTHFALTLVYEELVTNAAKYAFPAGEKQIIHCQLEQTAEGILFQIRYGGIPFDPWKQQAPDLSVPLEQRSEGGIGIFLVKKNSQKVSYRYQDNFNMIQVLL